MPPKINIYRRGELICQTQGVIGETVLKRVQASDVFLDAPCGGQGRCKKCLVRLSPDGEEVQACQTVIQGDMDIYLPDEMKMKIAGAESSGSKAASPPSGPLGVAVDIGTTTVVAHLTDLKTGARIATASGVNAQRPFGADVISRIQYCAANGHELLTRLIRDQLAELIHETCVSSGARAENITYVSIAGNTIMEHLAAGFSPVGMGTAPFRPVSLFGDEMPAGADLKIAPGAVAYYAPAIYSYVGGDITAGMLASDLEHNAGPCVYIDIGTNGEIAMKIGDQYYCCATAAGPAFEGAEITKGMAAVSGAISHVKWTEDNRLEYTVIGDTAPQGLCGSGLLDALALMIETGAVDESGRVLDAEELDHPISAYLGTVDGKNVLWLSRENGVYMAAADVRKLQLAKAATCAGIKTLMYHVGIGIEDVKSFLLAGGFGSYMDHESAAKIGLFPKEFLPIARTMGNTAGEGAAIALLSSAARATLSDIRDRCEYIELSTTPYFSDQFIEQMTFEG